ncbi:MAG: hypothetical protein ABSG33_00720 [Candidatus Bathyarchaeia archaeon]|jgi:hypothetical protein
MRKSIVFAVNLIVLLGVSLLGVAFAQSSLVGVKAGDWIQYQVTETGNPASEYNITWARMNIINVQGEVITVNVVTAFGNGTLFPENSIHLNLATGAIGDGFFVPLNLTVGDQYRTEYEGVINMTGTKQIEAGGAQRTVLIGVTNESTYNWDRQTGIMVAATSNLPGCVMYTTTNQTNLWAPQTSSPQPQIFGINQTTFYALIIGVIAVVAVLVVASVLFIRRRKKPVS